MLMLLLFFFVFIWGCSKDENVIPKNLTNDTVVDSRGDKVRPGYEQTNLVSDVAEYNPEIIDPNLVNAWGIAISPKGTFWISAADAHLSVIYNDEGETLRPPVTMTGYPTGQVYNGTSGFIIPGTLAGAAKFIFVTEDGYINAWNSGDRAMTMIDDSGEGASYTGVEMAMAGGVPYLYVTNNAEGSIDVYDMKWAEISTMRFDDPELPADAKPFNIRLIDGSLFVTYQTASLGGVVDVFTTDGVFVSRFAAGGTLNQPWGITATPPGFGLDGAYLIGNFGDGLIGIYTKDGVFKALLGDEAGNPIMIEGLWALHFVPAASNGSILDKPELYFTAGPDDEEHGLFGEIEAPQ
jgi:uncharacterized protein (TIGR03118 family)